ncbi:hypothetical protein COCCADRAFT_112827, partial [Bipolaris zeicola 26-R-13]
SSAAVSSSTLPSMPFLLAWSSSFLRSKVCAIRGSIPMGIGHNVQRVHHRVLLVLCG